MIHDKRWFIMVDRMEIEKKIERCTLIIDGKIESSDILDAYYNRGIAYNLLGQYEKSIEDFNYLINNFEDHELYYFYRDIAYYRLKDYDKAIEKNISLNRIKPYIYYKRGIVFFNSEKYEKAIEDFNYVIENSNDNANGFLSRGAAYYKLGNFKKAIDDFNQAIEEFNKIEKIEPKVYYNRGILYLDLGQYDKAIKDFSYYIENSKDNANGYLSRGDAYQVLGEFSKAIADYDKAISLNIQNPNAYFNRGLIYYQSKEYEKAIADFKYCIKINPNFIKAHFNIGRIYYIQDKYKESAEFFALSKKDPLFVLTELNKIEKNERRNKIRNVISEMIDLDKLNFFNRTTILLNQKNKQACKDIYITMLELISLLHINNEIESTFSHYTKRSTASQLIFKPSPFRLNSTITCNDPEEGKTLLKYLALDLLKDKIDNLNNLNKEHNYQAFIGCFTFNRESLNQFRLYGKEDNKEATGVSIEIKKKFFDDEIGVQLLTQICQSDISQLLDSESNHVKNIKKEDTKKKDKEENKKYALYRCIYLDPEIKRVISVGHKEEYAFYREKGNCSEETIKKYKDYKKDIDKVLKDVNSRLEELCERIEKAKGEKNENSPIICELLLPLRYLVKHVAFKEEQECRIFDVKDLEEDKIKDKNDKEIHFTDDFMQMYIEYQPITKEELAGVVFAPKAENIDVFNEALRQKDFEIQCERSTLPFA